MKRKVLSVLLALVLVLSFSLVIGVPVGAVGTDKLVPSEYATIQAAIDDADPGDTINVAAGEYAGAIVNKDVAIIGAVGGGSVITSGVGYKSGSGLKTGFRLDDGADGAEIRNFTMNGDYVDRFWFAVFARNADSVIVDSLALNDMVQGITSWGGSNWEITNNVITETYPTTGGGIAIYLGADPANFPHCDNNLVQGNTITTNRAQSSTFTGAAICLWFDERTYTEPTTQSMTGNEIKDNSITASGLENQVGIEIGVGGLDGGINRSAVCSSIGIV